MLKEWKELDKPGGRIKAASGCCKRETGKTAAFDQGTEDTGTGRDGGMGNFRQRIQYWTDYPEH